MKNLSVLFTFLAAVLIAQAYNITGSSTTTQTITVTGTAYDLNFDIHWSCDDFPMQGAQGKSELLDSSGTRVAAVWANVSRDSGPSLLPTGPGSTSNVNYSMAVWSADGSPADGDLTFTWNLIGLAPGTYTLRLWNYTSYDSLLHATTVWTTPMFLGSSVPAAPIQFVLTTNAGAGGTVSAGGSYDAGTAVTISAMPDGAHDFAGWSGDAGGTTNPLSLVMDGNKNVVAGFTTKMFTLTTTATAGGSVTPGGSYPYGTSITVSATPDASHAFLGWAGDAAGSAPSILVTVTSPLNVQAVFSSKAAQTISFPAPGNQPVGGPALALGASASSGLPPTYVVLSGPATLNGNQLTITGPGAVTVQASQPGDATYLPAPSVNQTFNAVATALLKYRPANRTLLQDRTTTANTPFVLETP